MFFPFNLLFHLFSSILFSFPFCFLLFASNFHFFKEFPPAVLQEVPEAVRIISQEEAQQNQNTIDMTKQLTTSASSSRLSDLQQMQKTQTTNGSSSNRSTILKSRSTSAVYDGKITNILDIGKVRSLPVTLSELEDSEVYAAAATLEYLPKEDSAYADKTSSFIDYVKSRKKQIGLSNQEQDCGQPTQQQILEELHVRIVKVIQVLFSGSTLTGYDLFVLFLFFFHAEGRP